MGSVFLVGQICQAQMPGSLDTTFDPGGGPNYHVYSAAVQPDGKLLIGGAFGAFNNIARSSIARLNSDGTLDPSFDPGSGANSYVYSVALQTDGKVVIGGWFNQVNGTALPYIARLNANGSLDPSFNPGSGANYIVYAVAIQPDGKILIGGAFSQVNGINRSSIARLNADGSVDTTFNPGTGTNSYVYTVALQSDGKVLIGGIFTQFNGVTRNYIARLNSDGSLDTGFDPGTGANSSVNFLAAQPGGKVILGGSFTQVNGTPRSGIARLSTSGSVDASFDPGTGTNGAVACVASQSDNKVLLGGNFSMVNGTTRSRVARLNENGSVDTSFDPGTGANAIVYTIVIQSDNKIVLGGNFSLLNGVTRIRLARLYGTPPPPPTKAFSKTGTSVTLTLDSSTGHTYQLQKSSSPVPATFVTDVGPPQMGNTGTPLTFTDAAATGPVSFYRVKID